MANIKSNIKRHNQDEKKRKLNHSKMSQLRTVVKKTKVSKKPEDLNQTYMLADKAAKTNRIHRNKANRIKSRTALAIKN